MGSMKLLLAWLLLSSFLLGHSECRGGGRGGGGRSGGGRGFGRSSSGGRSAAPRSVKPSSYPKQRWGSYSSVSYSSSRTGTQRLSTFTPRSYTPVKGRSGGHNGFPSITAGQPIVRRVSLHKKSVGLGAAAGFVAGRHTSHVGPIAYHGVMHRYLQYQYLKHKHKHHRYHQSYINDDDDWEGEDGQYGKNFCSVECPSVLSSCDLGICICEDWNLEEDGSCPRSYRSPYASFSDCSPKPDCLKCTVYEPCSSFDINLVCDKGNISKSAFTYDLEDGKCKCRENTKWNPEVGRCQLYLDADCSSFPRTSMASPNLVKAVEPISKKSLMPINVSLALSQSSKSALLSNSILNKIDIKNLTEKDLLEAYCRDVESFMADLEDVDRRPVLCPKVPDTACAMVFDSHDCSGGWQMRMDEGSISFPYFSSYWSYRNDIDTVGVRAGCTLQVFTSTDFQGNQGIFKAVAADNWWVLEDSDETVHLSNDIESLKCYCNLNQIKDLFE